MPEVTPGKDAEPEINAKLADLVRELVLLEHRMSYRNRQLLGAIARWASDGPITDPAKITQPPTTGRKKNPQQPALPGTDGAA